MARRLVTTISVLGLGILASCGTPEYRAEKQQCEAEWMMKIPPKLRQQPVTRYRSEQRPTGQTTCTTSGAVTTCQEVMTTVSVPYTAIETVDVRKAQRDPQIAACAARACMAAYGNPDCES